MVHSLDLSMYLNEMLVAPTIGVKLPNFIQISRQQMICLEFMWTLKETWRRWVVNKHHLILEQYISLTAMLVAQTIGDRLPSLLPRMVQPETDLEFLSV